MQQQKGEAIYSREPVYCNRQNDGREHNFVQRLPHGSVPNMCTLLQSAEARGASLYKTRTSLTRHPWQSAFRHTGRALTSESGLAQRANFREVSKTVWQQSTLNQSNKRYIYFFFRQRNWSINDYPTEGNRVSLPQV